MGCRRLVLAALSAGLAVLICSGQAAAATTVSGDRDANVPLEIVPDVDPQTRAVGPGGPSSDYLAYVEMPVTKRVASVTLGDLARGDGCSTDAEVHLFVYEYQDNGDVNQIVSSGARQRLGSSLERVTWAIPETTLKKGQAYSIGIGAPATSCQLYRQRTWAHSFSVVNGGPAKCTSRPSSRRMWHQAGVDDRNPACVTRTEEYFWHPSMPTGWLDVSAQGYVMTATMWTQPPSAASACSSPAAEVVYWRQSPGAPAYSDYVCRWPQFAPYGQDASQGWYYALPWPRDVAAPRDTYLKLDTIDYDSLLRRHSPQLRYDSQELYYADSARTITDNYDPVGGQQESNRLLSRFGGIEGVEAFSNPLAGTNHLTLEYLGHDEYPSGQPVSAEDNIDEANTYQEDAAEMHANPYYEDQLYARATHDEDGNLWLQYWLFSYYNDQVSVEPFAPDVHEGDWELIQVRLYDDLTPSEVTYSRHGDESSSCYWAGVEKLAADFNVPVAYVARSSHANYFEPGSYGRGLYPADNADGTGHWSRPYVNILHDDAPWVQWPGRWGGSGNSPPGPVGQGDRWSRPDVFSQQAAECLP